MNKLKVPQCIGCLLLMRDGVKSILFRTVLMDRDPNLIQPLGRQICLVYLLDSFGQLSL
jgi:hypothetical protein